MRTHNAALVRGKMNCILLEDELRQALNEGEEEAILYHEIGHLHTISSQKIFFLQCGGLLLSATGLHSILYGNVQYLVVVTGIGIAFVMPALAWIVNETRYHLHHKK